MAWGYRANSYANDGTGFASVTTGTTQTVTLNAAVSVGDLIVCHVIAASPSTGGSTPSFSVVDNLNAGSYIQDATQTYVANTDPCRCSLFSMPNSVAGTPIITVTITLASGTAYGGLQCAAYSGIATTTPRDGTSATATGTGTSASSGAHAATGAANELVVGGYSDNGYGFTLTSTGTGVTQRGKHDNDNFAWEGLLEDYDSGASGSTPVATCTISGTTTWGMLAAIYIPAAAGGQDTPELYGRPSRQMQQLLAQ